MFSYRLRIDSGFLTLQPGAIGQGFRHRIQIICPKMRRFINVMKAEWAPPEKPAFEFAVESPVSRDPLKEMNSLLN